MGAAEIVVNLLFYVFAAGAVGGSLMVAASRNIVRSAFSLLAVLFSVGALYALMRADFIAVAQVLIYVGGIMVLIIFAVMLTHRITDVNLSNESAPGPGPFFASLCLFLALGAVVALYPGWKEGAEPAAAKAGGVEMALAQYQSDGRTGLARGGNTLERAVVLEIQMKSGGAEGESVEVEAVPKGKQARPVFGRAPLRGGSARILLPDLPEGGYSWRARIVKEGGSPPAWTRPDGDKSLDFVVHSGLTVPTGRAFMGPYLFAFEAVSVLLLAALVGAAYLARKEVRE